MGLFDFLDKEETDLDREVGIALGLTEEEIEEAKSCGISPEEWLEENDPENYEDQELDE